MQGEPDILFRAFPSVQVISLNEINHLNPAKTAQTDPKLQQLFGQRQPDSLPFLPSRSSAMGTVATVDLDGILDAITRGGGGSGTGKPSDKIVQVVP